MTSRNIAWMASIAFHVVAFGVVMIAMPQREPTEPPSEVVLTVEGLEAEHAIEMVLTPTDVPRTPPQPPAESEPPANPTPAAPTGRPPVATPVPAILPQSVTALIRHHADRVTLEPVQEVVNVVQVAAVQPMTNAPSPVPAGNPPADSGTASPGPVAVAGGEPLHGALSTGQTVVYVLDCSGTMGLDGRWSRARSALLATVARQPIGVRVQVVIYNGRAAPLLPLGSEMGVEQIAVGLAKLEPAGDSKHSEGMRVAMKLSPTVVVFVTDAAEPELAELRPLLAGLPKSTNVFVARVTANGVAAPVAIK